MDFVEGQRSYDSEHGKSKESLALWGQVVTTQADGMGCACVLEESVLERPYWVLGLGVVVSHFAAVKAEVQRGTGKDLRPSALGVSAAARQVTTGDSVCPLR